MGRGKSGEARLLELALSLERAANSYAQTVDLIDQAGADTSRGPWLARMHERVRLLIAECRLRAGWLADTPATTHAGCVTKCRALLRYWEVDVDCDPRGLRVLVSVFADIDRLGTMLTAKAPPAEVLQLHPAKPMGIAPRR